MEEPEQLFRSVRIIGHGRAGSALNARLRERVLTGGWASRTSCCCVSPTAAIREVASTIEPGPWIAHISGATPLAALAPHVHRFGLHPLQTFDRSGSGDQLDGAWAAVTADTPAGRARGFWLAERLGVRPFEIRDEARMLYHAGRRDRVELPGHAVSVGQQAARIGRSTERALIPLMRRTIDNGFQLTGPIARGDWATIDAHLAAIHDTAPDLERMYRALAEVTAP